MGRAQDRVSLYQDRFDDINLIIPFVKRFDVWGIERSGFFNGREKWVKGFENQMV